MSNKTSNGYTRNGHANRVTELPARPLDTVSDGGHDANGRFTEGNKCAAGNPFARRMARLRSAFLDAAPAEKMRELAGKLLELALAGDMAAAKLVLLYALGRPVEMVDPDRLDMDEWRSRHDWPVFSDVLAEANKNDPKEALVMVQKFQPTVTPLFSEEGETDA